MIIKFFSDLHIEFGSRFLLDGLIKDTNPDIFVIAGDLHLHEKCIDTLKYIDSVVSVPVLFVAGNHEYYGIRKDLLDTQFKTLNSEMKHVRVLNRDTFKLDGITFAGATGWWDVPMMRSHRHALNDFNRIYDIGDNDHGTAWGIKDREWFETILSKYINVVCISHNAPSWKSILPQYLSSDINECFANKWDAMIHKYQPIAWIHGHMHNTIHYNIGETQIGCNPYGYYGYEVNDNFIKEGYLVLP